MAATPPALAHQTPKSVTESEKPRKPPELLKTLYDRLLLPVQHAIPVQRQWAQGLRRRCWPVAGRAPSS